MRSERRRRTARPPDAGMVTAETAVALPAMVVLAAMLVWAVLAAAGEVRCVDAARVGARAAARGDTDAEAVARAAAPPGARVEAVQGAETVRVTVEAPLPAPGKLGAAVAVRLRASAVAAREDVAGSGEGGAPWPS